MDKLSKEARSSNMSKIRGKDTIPEEVVRKYLFSRGLRYRKNDKRYPGKPDLTISKYHTIVFVNGCFWHGHQGCKDFTIPKTNTEFWTEKISGNVERDKGNYQKLRSDGWKVIIVWECELKKTVRTERMELLYREITEQGPLKRTIIMD